MCFKKGGLFVHATLQINAVGSHAKIPKQVKGE
jgi:hypothetical protein